MVFALQKCKPIQLVKVLIFLVRLFKGTMKKSESKKIESLHSF